jgi:hypothetical protein
MLARSLVTATTKATRISPTIPGPHHNSLSLGGRLGLGLASSTMELCVYQILLFRELGNFCFSRFSKKIKKNIYFMIQIFPVFPRFQKINFWKFRFKKIKKLQKNKNIFSFSLSSKLQFKILEISFSPIFRKNANHQV